MRVNNNNVTDKSTVCLSKIYFARQLVALLYNLWFFFLIATNIQSRPKVCGHKCDYPYVVLF